MIFPEVGLTKNNEWRFIVQDPNIDQGKFRQGIRVERCLYVRQIDDIDGIFKLI